MDLEKICRQLIDKLKMDICAFFNGLCDCEHVRQHVCVLLANFAITFSSQTRASTVMQQSHLWVSCSSSVSLSLQTLQTDPITCTTKSLGLIMTKAREARHKNYFSSSSVFFKTIVWEHSQGWGNSAWRLPVACKGCWHVFLRHFLYRMKDHISMICKISLKKKKKTNVFCD